MEQIKITDLVNGEYNCRDLPQKYNNSQYNRYTTFSLKHMSIINRLIYLNTILEQHYQNWQYLICEPKIDNSSTDNLFKSILKHKEWQRRFLNNYYEQEEIIMHLRKSIDDCISLLSIATNCFYKNKKTKISRPFESIGEYLQQINEWEIFIPHKPFLQTINYISNGFKHCVANSIPLKIGNNEPCIFVYENNGSYYNEIGITLNSLIKGFNEFFSTFDKKLKEK